MASAVQLFNLYKVTFRWQKSGGQLQAIMVSERSRVHAVKRARAFVATQYQDGIRFDEADKICRTPDDVLDWA